MLGSGSAHMISHVPGARIATVGHRRALGLSASSVGATRPNASLRVQRRRCSTHMMIIELCTGIVYRTVHLTLCKRQDTVGPRTESDHVTPSHVQREVSRQSTERRVA